MIDFTETKLAEPGRIRLHGVIWWLWTAFSNAERFHTFNVNDAWKYGEDDPDVAWLGECAWTCRIDNTELGLGLG